MKRLILTTLIIAACSAIADYFFPWWSIALVAAICCFAGSLRPLLAIAAGFLGIFLFWLVAGLLKDQMNGGLLAERMARLFKHPGGIVYILVASLDAGILGAMAGWAGALLRLLAFQPRTRERTSL